MGCLGLHYLTGEDQQTIFFHFLILLALYSVIVNGAIFPSSSNPEANNKPLGLKTKKKDPQELPLAYLWI
jgi:hypothetical protein